MLRLGRCVTINYDKLLFLVRSAGQRMSRFARMSVVGRVCRGARWRELVGLGVVWDYTWGVDALYRRKGISMSGYVLSCYTN